MMKAFYKTRLKGPGPYSARKKAATLALYDDVMEKQGLVSEVVSQSGVSSATLFRWLSEKRYLQEKLIDDEFMQRVTNAIAELTDDRSSKAEKLEATLLVVAWIRWPHKPQYLSNGIVSFLSAYLDLKGYDSTIADLPKGYASIILRNLRLRDLRNIFVGRDFDAPLYHVYPIDERHVDDRDVLAGITYLLILIGKNTDSRKSASLSKAFHIINTQAVKFYWYVGRRTLEKLWQEFGSASPFLFVERYHSKLSWTFEPGQNDLADKVDSLLSHPSEVETFFRHCRYAVEEVSNLLTARALENIRFPTFPDRITPLPFDKPPMTDAIRRELSDYSRHSKYLW